MGIMFFDKDLKIEELEQIYQQADKHYADCLGACVLAEGAAEAAAQYLCMKILSSKGVYPGHDVWVDFKSGPARMYYVRPKGRYVLLKGYTDKGKRSSRIDEYNWKLCHHMTPLKE
jgi:hypothetical protein